jgi:hypothetical protein
MEVVVAHKYKFLGYIKETKIDSNYRRKIKNNGKHKNKL